MTYFSFYSSALALLLFVFPKSRFLYQLFFVLQLLDWILATKVRRPGLYSALLYLWSIWCILRWPSSSFMVNLNWLVVGPESGLDFYCVHKYCTINHSSLELSAKALFSYFKRILEFRIRSLCRVAVPVSPSSWMKKMKEKT